MFSYLSTNHNKWHKINLLQRKKKMLSFPQTEYLELAEDTALCKHKIHPTLETK